MRRKNAKQCIFRQTSYATDTRDCWDRRKWGWGRTPIQKKRGRSGVRFSLSFLLWSATCDKLGSFSAQTEEEPGKSHSFTDKRNVKNHKKGGEGGNPSNEKVTGEARSCSVLGEGTTSCKLRSVEIRTNHNIYREKNFLNRLPNPHHAGDDRR